MQSSNLKPYISKGSNSKSHKEKITKIDQGEKRGRKRCEKELTCDVCEGTDVFSLLNVDESYFLFEVTDPTEWQHQAPPTHQGRQHRLHLFYC